MSERPTTKPMPKKSLGRGLGSLLGGSTEGAFGKNSDPKATAEVLGKPLPSQKVAAIRDGFIEPNPAPIMPKIPDHLRIWQIPIEKIKPNPKQPRQVFDKEPLDELAASIREKGILQPLLGRKLANGQFEIIAGERRWRAAQLADLKEVPVILKETSDGETLELALIENIQRKDLNAIEEAEAYEYLMTTFKLTQQELAQRVGKERATVANVLRLLNLCPEVRLMVSIGEVSLGHAKVLLAVPERESQIKLAEKSKKENLSVRALEQMIQRDRSAKKPTEAPAKDEVHVRHLQDELQKMIGSKVAIDYNGGAGKISLHFYSNAELNDLSERIRKAWQS